MVAKIDRTGERNINNFGSKMIISEYRNTRNINVYFEEYNWTAKSVQYGDFKNKKISCPYERRTCGVGYLGEGKYKVSENGKKTKCYKTWHDMLKRCYDEKFHKRELTYKNCKVCDEWLNFQNFAKWYYENYYEIEGERTELDKDILVKGNKIYSPETCVFVSHKINKLFVKRDKTRGEYPIGVCYDKQNNNYVAHCGYKNKSKHLGLYNTPEEAFKVYKQFKENYIKQIADEYKDKIPSKLYNALYEYKVNIND